MKQRDQRKKNLQNIAAFLYFPAFLISEELILKSCSGLNRSASNTLGGICMTAVFAFVLTAICFLFSNDKIGKVFAVIFAELLTIWFLLAYFTDNAYQVYMGPDIMFSTAGNVAGEFSDVILTVIKGGIGKILLFHIPVIVLVVVCSWISFAAPKRWLPCVLALVLAVAVLIPGAKLTKWKNNYDTTLRSYGVIPALVYDLQYGSSTAGTASVQFSIPESSPEVKEVTETVKKEETEESPVQEETQAAELPKHEMDLSLDDTDCSEELQSLNSYVKSLTPTSENEYTGMFKGKNLILICAESFSKEVIDENLTPTLYRMANKGIVFEDFYQPFWGGSTTTGEYSLLTGLIPPEQNAMQKTVGHNMYFTIGNVLQREGYASHAYHDGTVEYYHRDRTHLNLGYSDFLAIGNGMENGVAYNKYANSDLEMMEYTVPIFIDESPFSIYYMTISGHGSYNFEANPVDIKNEDAVSGVNHTKTVRAYLAGNMELEYALEYLIGQLEEKDLLEDTVIALVPDHYPYALAPSYAWGADETDLIDLYGYELDTQPKRDHNAAIIWCASMEDEKPIVVSDPSYSIDILPTLLNLFGAEYDSRLLPGRDVLSDEAALVIWADGSWMTEMGYYDAVTEEFTPSEGQTVSEEYLEGITAEVNNKLAFSSGVLYQDYYGYLFPSEAETSE